MLEIMVVARIKALWLEMPWKGKVLMVCFGLCMGSSALLYRGFLLHAVSWHWNGLGHEGGFDLHIAYFKTPFAQIFGGLLVLSVLGMALIEWLVSRED